MCVYVFVLALRFCTSTSTTPRILWPGEFENLMTIRIIAGDISCRTHFLRTVQYHFCSVTCYSTRTYGRCYSTRGDKQWTSTDYEAERLMEPSGTFCMYGTYTTSNKYVLWFIWKLSGRLRFPLFKNEKYVVFKIIRKIRLDMHVCNTLKYVKTSHQNARIHIRNQ